MPIAVFSPADAKRIGAVVRRVEKLPGGDQVIRRRKKTRSEPFGIVWAKTTASTNAHEYTVSIYKEYDCSGTAVATSQTMYVPAQLHKFSESFANNTIFPVVPYSSNWVAISAPLYTPSGSTQYFLSVTGGELEWIEAAEFECPS
jgi:hypothetical protein